jgi:hypothetical protein
MTILESAQYESINVVEQPSVIEYVLSIKEDPRLRQIGEINELLFQRLVFFNATKFELDQNPDDPLLKSAFEGAKKVLSSYRVLQNEGIVN